MRVLPASWSVPATRALVAALAVVAAWFPATGAAAQGAPSLDWERRGDVSGGNDVLRSAAADSLRLYAGGLTTDAAGRFDLYAAGFDRRTGATVWQVTHGTPAGNDVAAAVATAAQRVFAGGYTFDPATRRDAYVVALDAGTGAVLWRDRRDGARRTDDRGENVAFALAASADRV